MKKIISVLLVTVLLFAGVVPAHAATAHTIQPQVYVITTEGGEITPFFTAINSIRATILMSGNTVFGGAVVSHSGARANVRVTLQRSTDGGRTFSDFATLVNHSSSNRLIGIEGSRSNLDTSLRYRVRVDVTVFDANNRQIDSGTAFATW